MTPKITKEEYLRAISEGFALGLCKLVYSGTDMPANDFFDFLQKGVADGIERIGCDRQSLKDNLLE
jgi:hypothetical protein